MNPTDLTNWELLGILLVFTLLFAFFWAWFFEKLFQWDKAIGKQRKKLSTDWHRIKAVIIGLPTGLLAWAIFGMNWYAVLVWSAIAFLLWVLFDLLLNQLRNLKDKLHLGENFLDGVPWLIKLILLTASVILLIIYS